MINEGSRERGCIFRTLINIQNTLQIDIECLKYDMKTYRMPMEVHRSSTALGTEIELRLNS